MHALYWALAGCVPGALAGAVHAKRVAKASPGWNDDALHVGPVKRARLVSRDPINVPYSDPPTNPFSGNTDSECNKANPCKCCNESNGCYLHCVPDKTATTLQNRCKEIAHVACEGGGSHACVCKTKRFLGVDYDVFGTSQGWVSVRRDLALDSEQETKRDLENEEPTENAAE